MIDIAQYAGILDWAKHDSEVEPIEGVLAWRGKANWMTALPLK